MLVTLVWLAGRYEASQVQSRLERDAADAGSDIRSALSRNVQSLQALQAGDPGLLAWEVNAAELLRQRIFNRELAPGSWIDELKIAEEYGISRTPMREALKVLAAEGLVTMKVRRGAYVTEVNEKDQRDVYHLLSLLESDAAGVVANSRLNATCMY